MDRPTFRLARVFADGTTQDLGVHPVTSLSADLGMNRRGLLGTGVAMSSLAAGLAGCAPPKTAVAPKTPPPPAPTAVTGTSGPLQAHETSVTGLTLAADGRSMISSAENGGLKTWSFPSGEYRSPFVSGSLRNGFQALLLSPDGRKLATETHDLVSNEIAVRSYPAGAVVATMTGHTQPVASLASTPDSRTLVSGGEDHSVRLWSLEDGKPIATLQGHQGTVSGLQVSPDGQTLYSASADGTIRVWSIPTARFNKTLTPSVQPVGDIALSRDGRLLAAGSHDGTVHVWSVPDGTLKFSEKYHADGVRSIQFAPDGDTLITGSDDRTVKRYSINGRRVIDEVAEGIGRITRVLLSPDGVGLLIGTALGIIVLWDLAARRIRTWFFDRSIVLASVRGTTYSQYDDRLGRSVSYTMPCGTPVPLGAQCVCNCVEGMRQVPRPAVVQQPAPPRVVQPPPPPPVYRPPVCTCAPMSICTCNQVCTCIPQCLCLAVLR